MPEQTTGEKLAIWPPRVALAIWGALLLMAMVVCGRRWAGALTNVPEPWIVCALVTLAFGLSLLAHRLALWARNPADSSIAAPLLTVAPLVPPVLLSVGVWPGNSVSTFSYVTALFVVALGLTRPAVGPQTFLALRQLAGYLGIATYRGPSQQKNPPSSTIEGQRQATMRHRPHGEAGFLPDDRLDNHPPPEGRTVWQWLRRSTAREADECIEGTLRVCLQPGEKQTAVHVPFWPPLGASPELSCRLADETSMRLKVGAVYSYGIRLEIRRSAGIDEPAVVEIAFTATAFPPNRPL